MIISSNRVIEKGSLQLRPITESEVGDEYVGWLNDSEVNQFLEVRHSKNSLTTCREFVRSMNESDNNLLLGIFYQFSHIGNVKVTITNSIYHVAEIGLLIGNKKYWGKGIATDVIQLMTNYAFQQLNLKKLEAGCYEMNMGSLRTFLKCGYSVEGFIRNNVEFNASRIGCFRLGISSE